MLRALDAAAIVRAVGDTAERWSDADFPPRVRVAAAIERRLGYTQPVVDFALDRLFEPLRAAALEAAIVDELGSLRALDGFTTRRGRPDAYARGVDRVVVVSSDTTIGVALIPAIFALCAKCDVVVKDRSDGLAGAFFAGLSDEHPAFASAARARAWDGAADAEGAALLAAADVVVAFGGPAALRAIRERCATETRFVPFGHRTSAGFVRVGPGEGCGARLADAVARDALLYDGEGCLSLHALFVAGDDAAARAWCSELDAAFERAAVEFPPGALDPRRAAAVAAFANLSTFRAAGGRGAVYARDARGAVLAYEPPHDRPPPLLPRVLPVFRVDGIEDVAAYLRTHRVPVQALAVVAPAAAEAAELAAAIGAVRIATFGTLQAPPPAGHHGGAPRIADFVRWIDRE